MLPGGRGGSRRRHPQRLRSERVRRPPVRSAGTLRITHSGSLFYNRIPHAFFDAVADVLAADPGARDDLRLHVAGRIDTEALALLRREPWRSITTVGGFQPHKDNLRLLRSSRLLLLLIGTDAQSKTMVTCKVYEYLAAGVPILAIGPLDGDAAAVLRETGSGWILDHQDRDGLAGKLRQLLAEHRRSAPAGNPNLFGLTPDPAAISRYSRKEQAAALAELLDRAPPHTR